MTSNVRVRFAPSPTGYLHVGGARTAIFNYLFARQTGGAFVLRIEDTDIERSTEASELSLIADLEWLGLDWQEGPHRGGDHGPYRQSERLAIYRNEANALIAAGVAYPCFCSDETLTAKKEAAAKAGKPPQYDGTCRDLDADTIARNRTDGVPGVVRFKVPAGDTSFEDIVRGQITIANSTVGDFVIVRSNEHPTYNFAAAVDDHLMGMTHVLRGEEHLPNTLRQILIYNALGVTPPRFGHVPLILAEDRSKLSKRHGASSVEELRSVGFLPEAVVNYLVLLGWSHPDAKEVMSLDEMVASFTLERINKSAAVYDQQKMRWMNGQHIRAMSIDELFPVADPFLPQWMREEHDEAWRRAALALLQDSIEVLSDLDAASAPLQSPPEFEEEARQVLATDEAKHVLDAVKTGLSGDDQALTAESFKAMMKAAGKSAGVKGKSLFFPVRAAITGAVHGPDLAGTAALKGKDTLIELIDHARSVDA